MRKYIVIIRANYEPDQPKVEEIEAETVLDVLDDIHRRYHLTKQHDGATNFNEYPSGISVQIGTMIPLITGDYF